MKIIIPLAGKGTRMRPHTHTRPKPLIQIAGKPVLGHILDTVVPLKVEEVIFITGHLGNQIEEYVRKHYSFPCRFIEQKELKGQAHAVALAKDFLQGGVIIWFVDTISDADLKGIEKVKEDGVIFVKAMEDPRRFGVVEVDSVGIVTDIVEKPEHPKSNLVNIGLYYVKDSSLMLQCIEELMRSNKSFKGEFFLVDAFNLMIKRGTRFGASEVSVWQDCGTMDATLETNTYYLRMGKTKAAATKNAVLVPPVYIEDGASIENSVVGPNVSVAADARIVHAIVNDSIIGEGAHIENVMVHQSIVGDNATLKGTPRRFNIGDDSSVEH
ncbi:MAG: sugar phosphate nucleotidyltransferase [Nanoarchaeota archaeon]